MSHKQNTTINTDESLSQIEKESLSLILQQDLSQKIDDANDTQMITFRNCSQKNDR